MESGLIRTVLKRFYKLFFLSIVKKINTHISSKIPKYELDTKHIKNAKLLTTREELLKKLPQNAIVAELGVDKGDFSNLILNKNNPQKLHLVDSWDTKRYNQAKRRYVEKRFAQHLENKSVEMHFGFSTKVVDLFADHYFDWIYIDTSHLYDNTRSELELYRNKVKENGIIAGHDYILGNWNKVIRFGVIEAVYEFCVKYNWEIIYLTTELGTNPSFAIKKIVS